MKSFRLSQGSSSSHHLTIREARMPASNVGQPNFNANMAAAKGGEEKSPSFQVDSSPSIGVQRRGLGVAGAPPDFII